MLDEEQHETPTIIRRELAKLRKEEQAEAFRFIPMSTVEEARYDARRMGLVRALDALGNEEKKD